MTASKARLAGILILTFILFPVLQFSAYGADYREVMTTISEAEQAMAAGFEAVLDAEQAGANVSSLLAKLSEGAEHLAAARMAFEGGNYSEAERLSGLASEVGAQVESDAFGLKMSAISAAFNRFRLCVAISVVAMATVVIATLLAYRLIRKRYFKRLLEMKPEVNKA